MGRRLPRADSAGPDIDPGIAGVLAILLFVLLSPGALAGQSVVTGELRGTVVAVGSDSGVRAVVTLAEDRIGLVRQLDTDADGRFGQSFLPPGRYRLRIEALGFAPVVVEAVPVDGGRLTRVPVELRRAEPPVTRVDTLTWSRTGLADGRDLRLGADEIAGLPHRDRDLLDLARLASFSDRDGGIDGLPGSMTTVVGDGVAMVRPVSPWGAESGLDVGAFPLLGLSRVEVTRGVEDIEWAAGQGGSLRVDVRPRGPTGGFEAFGLAASDALWSAQAADDPEGFTSFWGGAAGSVSLKQDTAALSLAVEGARVSTPIIPSPGDAIVAELLPERVGPGPAGLEETTALAGSGRLDWTLGNTGLLTARVGFGHRSRETGSPVIGPPGSPIRPPEERTDLSVAAALVTPLGEASHLELRGGVGSASREVSGLDLPSTTFPAARAFVGMAEGAEASVDRRDLGLTALVHYHQDQHRVKVGGEAGFSTFEEQFGPDEPSVWTFADGTALAEGRGRVLRMEGLRPPNDYSTARFGGFVQYQYVDPEGFDFALGARYEREALPVDDLTIAEEWAELTGLVNVETFPENLTRIEGRTFLRWNPGGASGTRVELGAALQQGPLAPRGLAEVVGDGTGTVLEARGEVPGWPDAPSVSLTSIGSPLSFFGLELDAPVTVRAVGSVAQRVAPGFSVGVAASWRRTEFLLRRRDLNLATGSAGEDQFGRPVLAPLSLEGGLLGAEPGAARRFPGFASVWALESDGWSEHRGVTAFAEVAVGEGSVRASYTNAETEDNWVGAAEGGGVGRVASAPGNPVWAEGPSDFESPHTVAVTAVLPLPLPSGGSLAGVYRLSSPRPFTPTVARGHDADGDGSAAGDVAFVPDDPALASLLGTWDCLAESLGAFAARNGCRGDPVHRLDLRVSFGLPLGAGRDVRIVVDALNLLDAEEGIRDGALLLVDPDGEVTVDGDRFHVPYRVNPDFGQFLLRTDRGRLIRLGVRIGVGS